MVGERASLEFLATNFASDNPFIVISGGVKDVGTLGRLIAVFFVRKFILILLVWINPFLPHERELIPSVLVVLVKVVLVLLGSWSRSTTSAGKIGTELFIVSNGNDMLIGKMGLFLRGGLCNVISVWS